MSLRSDNVSGAITCAFGIVMICFASFGLMIVVMQRVMLATMPPIPQGLETQSFMDAMYAIHGVWFIYMPIMIVGGIIFAVAGLYVRRGSVAARHVAQANAIAGYIWLIAYAISCYQVMKLFSPLLIPLPEPVTTVYQWFSIISGTLVGAVFPTGLLYILSRGQPQAIDS